MKRVRVIKIALSLLLLTTCAFARGDGEGIYPSEDGSFLLEKIESDLERPWSLAILPGEEGMLITERPGRLILLDSEGRHLVDGLPPIAVVGQGGLLDVIIDPGFTENRRIYLSYAEAGPGGYFTAIARGRLEEAISAAPSLSNLEVIFRAQPKTGGGRHFGSRLLFGADGYLYITLGERGIRSNAQDLSNHGGTVTRIAPDGSVPADNPFINTPGASPEIYSYGHRNAQGMAMDEDGTIWLHEHGPKGGDELNIIKAGANYGWPVITYGINYDGTIITEETSRPGMEQPETYWVPSIAPSGMAFYYGDAFPKWRGDIFLGALAGKHLRRLKLEGNRVVHQEVLLHNRIGRIRDVRIGLDGFIYLLTDEERGALYRLSPAE